MKVVLFYANIKPYFSVIHNIAIGLFLWPLYVLAGRTAYAFFRKPEVMMLGIIIAFQGLIVGLTTENWDGRFLIPVLPFVFVLAGGFFETRDIRGKIKDLRHESKDKIY